MKNEKYILKGSPIKNTYSHKSAGEYFMEKIKMNGSKPSMINVETGEELTYQEVLDKSLKLAISLDKLGLRLNDRIGICSENHLNFGIVTLSSIFLGTTICPINPAYVEREIIHTLTISQPKCIFVSISCLARTQKIVKNLPWHPKLILLYPDASTPEIPDLPDLIVKIGDFELRNFKLPEIDINDHVVLIACSSGTTGLPKGVMLNDINVLAQMLCLEDRNASLVKNSNVLGMLPMYHAYGFFVFLSSLVFGKKLIVISKFNEHIFLEAVEKYRIDTLTLVPPLMVFLAKNPIVNKYDLSCVKKITCGAAPLPKGIEEAIKQKFKIPFITNGYGMTETTLSVTYSTDVCKVNSVGKLVRGMRAKVVQLDGSSRDPLGPNCEGELCFKGDLIMKGYCGDEKSTKAIIDEDGFLHTGDVGYYDEDEFFFIVDRIKELIKYKGFQVPPAELESILLTHPAIKDAAVVGLPDELAGELPLAFVVKQPGTVIRAEEIIEFVNARVSSQKNLRGGVRFIEAIPKNLPGKILRRELRNILKSNL